MNGIRLSPPNWWQLSLEVDRLSPRSSSRGTTRADKENKFEHICSSLMPPVEQSFKSSSPSELLKSKLHQQQKSLGLERKNKKLPTNFFLCAAFSLSLVRVRFGDFGKLGCFRCQMVDKYLKKCGSLVTYKLKGEVLAAEFHLVSKF